MPCEFLVGTSRLTLGGVDKLLRTAAGHFISERTVALPGRLHQPTANLIPSAPLNIRG
jgi:hypothetical protein